MAKPSHTKAESAKSEVAEPEDTKDIPIAEVLANEVKRFGKISKELDGRNELRWKVLEE